MPQFERRLYEPSDDVRVFDGGEDDLDEEGSRLPLLIIIALVVLLSFAGVVWLAYTQGVERGRLDAPRIMTEQQNQKIALGEQKNPYANLKIYQPPSNQEAAGTASESPPPMTRRAEPSPTPATVPAPKAAELSTIPKRPAPKPGAINPTSVVGAKPNEMAPLKPQAVPASRVPPAMHSTAAAPRQIAPAATPGTSAPQVSAPLASQSPALNIGAPQPNVQTNMAALNPTAGAAPTQSTAAGSSYVLQIGSYTSEAEANASWQTYKQSHASVAGFSADIKAADLGAKGTWYRLRVGPFATLGEANAACAKLKAQGARCFPAKQ